MARTIDQRVVEMRFDNSDFEKNVETSRRTLRNLDSDLNNFGGSSGLSAVSVAINGVGQGFSKLEEIAIGALRKIGEQAVEVGEKFVKAMTVDNVAAGWDKFGDKTRSVATLVAQGFDLDTVNAQLEKLNWFTDETSYNFTDMVSSISKFTATGQDLETSVVAMEGIANWAALSGQNAGTASRAMYQLSQAMGLGALKLQDYRSIQNASMDTAEFREHALAAAVANGKLTKSINDQGEAIYKVAGKADHIFTQEQFTTYLADEWFDAKTMMDVFQEYAGAVEDIYDVASEQGVTASEAIAMMGDSVDEFGLKAFRAAQEARTWEDVTDSVKDAVSTGWMNIFQLLIGNQEQAVELWTDLANELYDVFAEPLNNIIEILKEWNTLGGRDDLVESFWNLFDAIKTLGSYIGGAFKSIFPGFEEVFSAEGFMAITKKIKEFTVALKDGLNGAGKPAQTIMTVLKGIFSVVKMVADIVKNTLGSALKGLFGEINKNSNGSLNAIQSFFQKIIDFSQSDAFQKILDNLSKFSSLIGKIAGGAFSDLIKMFGNFADGNFSLSALSDGILGLAQNGVTRILTGLGDLLGIDMSKFVEMWQKVSGFIRDAAKAVTDFVGEIAGGLFHGFMDGFNEAGGGLSGVLTGIWQGLENVVTVLIEKFGELTGLDVSKVTKWISDFGQKVKDFVSSDSIQKFTDFIAGLFEAFKGNLDADASGFEVIASKIGDFFKKIGDAVKDGNILEKVKNVFNTIGEFFKNTFGKGDNTEGMFKSAKEYGVNLSAIGEKLREIFTNFFEGWKDVDPEVMADKIIKILEVIAGIIAAISGLVIVMNAAKMSDKANGVMDSAKGALDGLKNFFKQTGNSVKGLLSDIGQAKKMEALSEMVKAFAIAIGVMAAAIFVLALIPTEGLWQGFAVVTLLIGQMVTMVKLLQNVEAKQAAGLTAVFVAFAATMLAAAAALTIIGQIGEDDTILISGLTLVGVILALAEAVKIMENSTKGAGALMLASLALMAISVPIAILAQLPMEGVVVALLGIAGAIAILGVAAAVLGEYAPVMIAIAGAFALLGAGAMLIGAGISMAMLGLTAFVTILLQLGSVGAEAAANMANALKEIILAVASTLPEVVTQIGLAIVAFCEVIANSGSAIMEAVTKILSSIIQAIINITPQLFEMLGVIIDNLLVFLMEYVPKITGVVLDIIIAVLQLLVEHLPEILDLVLTTILQINEALIEYVPIIVEQVFRLLLAILEVLTEYIDDLIVAGTELALAILKGLVDSTVVLVEGMFELILALINGITEALEKYTPLLIDAIDDLIATLIVAAIEFLISPVDVFMKVGKKLMHNGFFEGLRSQFSEITDGIKTMLTNMMKKVTDKLTEWKNAGKDLLAGFAKGIGEKAAEVVETAKQVATNVLNGVKKVLGIHSPSRAMAQVGMYTDRGLALGISKYSNEVTGSGEEMASGLLSTVGEILSNIDDEIDDEFDPVITPIIDLSEVQNGINSMDGMLDDNSMSVNASARISSMSGSIFDRMADLLSGGSSRGSNIGSIDITINAGANQDAEEIAREAIDMIKLEIAREEAAWA